MTVPNSPPLRRNISPVASCNSEGNGPAPTRVQYALATPTTRPIAVGPRPRPVHAPPAIVCELVTNGIGAVPDVEQRALRAFDQDAFARLRAHRADTRRRRRRAGRTRGRASQRARSRASASGAASPSAAAAGARFRASRSSRRPGSPQIGERQPAARDFIGVGRADAAPRRPSASCRAPVSRGAIELRRDTGRPRARDPRS